MNKQEISERIQKFMIRIFRLAEHLQESDLSGIITSNVLESVILINRHYRAACRISNAKEQAEKLNLAAEATDQTLFWLEFVEGCNLINPEKIKNLKTENAELLSILSNNSKTAKRKAT